MEIGSRYEAPNDFERVAGLGAAKRTSSKDGLGSKVAVRTTGIPQIVVVGSASCAFS